MTEFLWVLSVLSALMIGGCAGAWILWRIRRDDMEYTIEEMKALIPIWFPGWNMHKNPPKGKRKERAEP